MEWLLESLLRDKWDMGILWGQLTHALACRHCGSSCFQSPGTLATLFLFMIWQIRRWWQLGKQRQLQPWYSGDMTQGKTIGTPEQVLTQTPIPSRSFPTFQILTNLPVRHNRVSGRCLQQRKNQLFWGLPSLHSEFLEAIFLSSGGPSPLKLSAGPSVFFNKFDSLSRTDLLFPKYCFPARLPTNEIHTTDLERVALDPQQLPFSSFPPILSLPLHLKPFPTDNKGALPGPEAHTQWLKQQRDVPWVSENQALHPQPKLQRTRQSKLLNSSEVQRELPRDLSLQQHILEPRSASLLYPSSLLVLTGSEVPCRAMGQNEDPKASKPPMPAPSPASLPELQGINPVRDLTGSQASWETTSQRKKFHTCESSVLATCQSIAPNTGPEGINPLGMPPGYETHWGSNRHEKNLQVSEFAMPPASCQSPYSQSKPQKDSPEGECFACTDFWGIMGHKENSQVSGSLMPAHSSPPDPLAELKGGRSLGDPFGYTPQWGCRENSGKPWAFEPLDLKLNPVIHETSPACVPSVSENSWEGMQDREILWVSVDPVSSPNLPSVALLESLVAGPQGVLSKSKSLWRITGQGKISGTSQSPAPAHSPPLDPILESHRINSVGVFTRSDAARKDIEHSRKSEPPYLALRSTPALTLEPLRDSLLWVPFDSENRCGGIQRKNSWVSKIPDCSLLQDPHDTSPLGLLSASEPVWRDMGHKEISCVPVSPVWDPSPLPKSTSKSHISEPSGDQCNCKPEGEAMEEREDSWATKLLGSIPNSLSAPLPNSHIDLEFVWRTMQHRAIPQGSSPPAVDFLKPIPWLPTLAEALKIEPQKSGLPKGTPFPRVKTGTLPSQGEAVPEVPTHSGIQAWHWSSELEVRLKNLQQSPASRSPGSNQPFGRSPALNSTTPGSWELSSCPPQQTPAPTLCPHSSSCHPPKVQSTVQVSHCHHSSQSQPEGSGKAKQGSEREENMKEKMAVQVSSQRPCRHTKAGESWPGIRKPSSLKVPVSGKRQDKASALSLAKERGSPRRWKEIDGGGDARLGSPTVKGRSHPAQAQRLVQISVNKISQRPPYRDQSCRHTLPQQLNSKVAGPQDQRGAGMGAGDIPKTQHCKHCPWAHMKHLSSTPQDPLTRSLQRVLAKLVGTNRPCSPSSVSREKAGSTGTQ
ncbi:hypothetical protein J0S82_015515 [Galemys pyrenaicus]|uniref:SPATA31 domain-containing protein n=1 Tax=Galemys pyrenaicus TaxID=202257 RepID=A0A8J5ZSW3_GALPY|nr:hypothetical protein J0S82_015515 [Galemys pyrenaicus]